MSRRTVIATAVVVCLLGFLAVTLMVVTGTGVAGTDGQINRSLAEGICCTPTQTFWDRFTTVFSPPVDATVLAVTGVVLTIRWRRFEPAMTAAWAVAVGAVAGLTLKYAVGRPPPWGPVQAQGSYPSGHTLSAIVFLGTAVLIASRGRVRPWLIAAVVVLTGLVGTGLVYDRYHWLSDVLGSICLGPVLLYWVTLTPPYRTCQRVLQQRLVVASGLPRRSDAQRAPDDFLHDLGGSAVDRLHP